MFRNNYAVGKYSNNKMFLWVNNAIYVRKIERYRGNGYKFFVGKCFDISSVIFRNVSFCKKFALIISVERTAEIPPALAVIYNYKAIPPACKKVSFGRPPSCIIIPPKFTDHTATVSSISKRMRRDHAGWWWWWWWKSSCNYSYWQFKNTCGSIKFCETSASPEQKKRCARVLFYMRGYLGTVRRKLLFFCLFFF